VLVLPAARDALSIALSCFHTHASCIHLGTLDAPREGRDVGSKPEDSVWWTYPEDRSTKQVSGWEILAKKVSSVKH
jgi:hypothetical protein